MNKEIEAVISHQKKSEKVLFLIKWKGLPASENSWETPNSLGNSKILDDYQNNNLAQDSKKQKKKIVKILGAVKNNEKMFDFLVQYRDSNAPEIVPYQKMRENHLKCLLSYLEHYLTISSDPA